MTERGVLAVVSGFSGSGKGTLMKELMKLNDSYALSISATTRAPREGEVDGREYFFLTREKFEDMIEKGELIEYAQYVGNYYGTPKAFVEKQMKLGKNVILEIEVQGAMNVKKIFPEAVTIFVSPPTAEELYRRLVGRGTESQEVIEGRMRQAMEEANLMSFYDFLLINDDLDSSVRELNELIMQSRKKMCMQTPFIDNIKAELFQINNKGE